jgi:predicted TIM-barrel fold metal-dependent hydrolase
MPRFSSRAPIPLRLCAVLLTAAIAGNPIPRQPPHEKTMPMFEPPSPPQFAVPAGGCDCHVHLFGPFERYPLDGRRLYTPDPALASDLTAMLDGAGLGRAVLVQPSAYGTDNRCMLDALAEHPQRLRGVVVIDPDAAEADELAHMRALGVRGVRLNLATAGGKSAAETAQLVDRLAARIAPLGWHLQVFVTLDVIAAIAPIVRRSAVDIVFDHMGMAQAARGMAQEGLSTLLDLLQTGRVWVKLSGTYRVSTEIYGNPQVTALARMLIAANAERVVWASDWPHIGAHPHDVAGEPPQAEYRKIDYGRLLSGLAAWADADEIDRILVRNPAALYGFS